MPKLKTTQSVIAEFKSVHGHRYGYELVTYLGSSTKVKVVCAHHGQFEIESGHHRNGVGCRLCCHEAQRLTKDEFISQAQVRFGDRYNYDDIDELPSSGQMVSIKCNAHDLNFLQDPRSHRRGHVGCPKCKSLLLSGDCTTRGLLKSADKLSQHFVEKARDKHGSSYDYSEFKYLSAHVKGKLICQAHGEFWQAPSNHLRSTKCPQCAKHLLRSHTFKQRCEELGVDYWRALKRREAGMSVEKIFSQDYVRGDRETTSALSVDGARYPNIEAACRWLRPTASPTTIGRWIRGGMTPEDAFERIPNPGYAAGLIYEVIHVTTGKRYVGLTIQTLERRWASHLEQARGGYIKGAESLHAAIREHGPDPFTIVRVDTGTTKVDLEQKERYWIKEKCALFPAGFNLSTGGGSGGSNRKPVTVDGIKFPSVCAAVEFISQTKGISLHAAKARLRVNRVNVKTPAKKGESLLKSSAYKAWSRIVHGVMNPKAKSYAPGMNIHDYWRKFDAFLEDVGHAPEPGMALTRLDKSKGFSPGNCSWLTKSEASKINAASMKKNGTLVGNRTQAL